MYNLKDSVITSKLSHTLLIITYKNIRRVKQIINHNKHL